MSIDLNSLNGPQRKIVRDALLSAFDGASLDILLEDEFSRALHAMVEQNSLEVMVFNLIRVSQREGWTDRLVSAAERASKNPKIIQLKDTLKRAAAIDLEKVDAQVTASAPSAIGGLERIVRKGGFADWSPWVNRMAEIGHHICRIEFPLGVRMGGGTGFLVAPDLVFTNYHVIEKHQQGSFPYSDITCRFDFDIGGSGTPVPVKLAANALVDFSRYSPHDPGDRRGLPELDQLDYALLRLDRPVGEELVNGIKRGWLSLRTDTAPPDPGDIIFIGQHPALEPLKIAVGTVLKSNDNGTRLRYDANTEPGSSGSPCLDVGLNVIALHHGGDPDYSHLKGEFNQGIPMDLILKRLAGRPNVTKFWS